MQTISLLLVAYLWGSLSPAFVMARWLKGIDLRHYGSGNIGSSNVGEQLGRAWTIGVGCLDLLKGLLPSFIARACGFDLDGAVLASLMAVVGHNWSIYLGFTGGRGMATTIGVLFAWDLRLAILLLGVLAIGWVNKQSALGTMIGLMLLPPSAWLLGTAPEIVTACVLLVFVIVAKRLEANRLPLPTDTRQKRTVLLQRFWHDRDVPVDQPWQERRRID